MDKLYIEANYTKSTAKDKPVWFIYFSAINPETGKMKRKKIYKGITGTDDAEKKRSAEKLILFYNDKLQKGWNPWSIGKDAFFKYSKAIDINAICNLYIKSRVLRRTSLHQYNSKTTIITQWCQKQDIKNCNQLNITHAETFIKHLADIGKSSSLRANFLSFLNSVFNYGIKKRLVFNNPWAELDRPKKNQRPAVYINSNDLPEIIEVLSKNKQLWLLCQWVYYCFIRPFAELRMIQACHINYSGQSITIPSTISKNKKTETLPIPAPLFRQLGFLKQTDPDFYIFGKDEIPGPKPVSKNYYARIFKTLFKNTPYNRYTIYSFKHTGAIMLIKSGCSVKEIQMQMRHHSLDETDKYLRQMKATESDFLLNKFPELVF